MFLHVHWHLQRKAICFLRHLKPHIRNTLIYFFFLHEQHRFSLAGYLMPIPFQKKSITCCYMFILLFVLNGLLRFFRKQSLNQINHTCKCLQVNIHINNTIINRSLISVLQKQRESDWKSQVFSFQLLYFFIRVIFDFKYVFHSAWMNKKYFQNKFIGIGIFSAFKRKFRFHL